MHIKSRTQVTAAVSIIALIAAVSFNGCASLRPPAPAAVDITGTWRADIETPQGDIELFMKISKSTAGTFTTTLELPVMGAYDIPVVFSFKNDVVHWEVEEYGSFFDGKLTDASTIEGTSSQPDGTTTMIVFKRVE